MNRYVIIIFFWLICVLSKAQLNRYFGVWFTPTNESLLIDSMKLEDRYTGTLSGIDYIMYVSQFSDTLSFKSEYYTSERDCGGVCVDNYDFKVIELNDSLLTVEPISDFSRLFYGNKKTLSFIKQGYLVDKNIQFEKLLFKITYEFDYPYATYFLEIDNNKNIKLGAKNIFKEGSKTELDGNKNGQFEGVLSDSIYNELLYNLQICNLKENSYDRTVTNENLNDIFLNYLIVSYNNETKLIDNDINIVTAELNNFLSSIILETKFEKLKKMPAGNNK